VKGGVEHRETQTCPRCARIFLWSPGLGLCPYCDLSQNARQTGPYGHAEPCPSHCCKEKQPASGI
jgi:hypothetical protein